MERFHRQDEMTWVQYRDAALSPSSLFEIDAIPRCFTIDADGADRGDDGSGSDVEGKLKKLLAKAKAAAHTSPVQTASN